MRLLELIGVCSLCKRQHDNVGFAPTRGHPVKWFCFHCLPYAKETYRMKRRDFDVYETAAMLSGGANAGQYLDELGRTDLATLDELEFIKFFAKFMAGYEDSMRGTQEKLKETF